MLARMGWEPRGAPVLRGDGAYVALHVVFQRLPSHAELLVGATCCLAKRSWPSWVQPCAGTVVQLLLGILL